MTSELPSHGEQAPSPSRRRLLKYGFRALLGVTTYETFNQALLPMAWWRNATQVETNYRQTPELTVVAPGINRKHARDIAQSLEPSLGKDGRPLASIIYSDREMDAAAVATDIRNRGCKKLGWVGHSIGSAFGWKVLRELLPELRNGQLEVDYFIMLSSPHSSSDLQNQAAKIADRSGLVGVVEKMGLDLADSGRVNWTSPDLWESQLETATNFDGSTVVPELAPYIRRALYIGAPNDKDDGVIFTHKAAAGYRADLGHRLTVVRPRGIGHADPDKHPDIYNPLISQWLADTAA